MAIVDKIKVGTVTYDIGVAAGNVSGTLAASNIPNISADKITSGTLPIARGGTNATTAAAALTSLGAAAASHNHAAGNITSGTLALARGGTGITVNPSMLTNLGTTSAASVFAVSPRPGVTGTLPIANGGTGKTTAADARTALGAAASSHNHAASNINSGKLATARLPISTTQSNSNATVPTSALVYSMNKTLTSLNDAIGSGTVGNYKMINNENIASSVTEGSNLILTFNFGVQASKIKAFIIAPLSTSTNQYITYCNIGTRSPVIWYDSSIGEYVCATWKSGSSYYGAYHQYQHSFANTNPTSKSGNNFVVTTTQTSIFGDVSASVPYIGIVIY